LTKDVPGALNEARNNLRGAFCPFFYIDIHIAILLCCSCNPFFLN
jgi:hypothetical protein